jgi:acetylornithine deacetylase/succinyl-diaminopimelate desuccinylase-like protein
MHLEAIKYYEDNYDSFVSELNEFLSIPSVSTDPERKQEVARAANFLANKLNTIGVEHVQVIPTKRHPIVYGDHLHAGSGQPTILIYGHYDVQPEDPLELWHTVPFNPVIINENLYARGASDMKGQVFACLASIESIIKTSSLPINVKFIFEGEEEIGSPNLVEFLNQYKDLLKSDCALNTDAGMTARDKPTITYGLRGLAYFELRIYGPERDLHSGSYGGVVHNPAQVLVELISKMHDENGHVTLPGFYDHVLPLSVDERASIARYSISDEEYCKSVGVPALWGEKQFTATERIGARPTLEINGILSGFVGQGSKTIIPSKAMAKISTRLVPNQKPELVYSQLLKFIEANIPATVRFELEQLSTGSPSISDTSIPETRAMADALKTVWGIEPLYKREGGSVPVVADMQEILKIDSVLTGFGLPDDRVHSPNEKLDLPTWRKGTIALIHFFNNLKRT